MNTVTTKIFLPIILFLSPTLVSCTSEKSNEAFTEYDINCAVEQVIDDATTVLDTAVVDLNFDGTDELLVLSSWGRNEIHVFQKSEKAIEKLGVFGMGKLNYISELNLYPCNTDDEKFYCFEFHYDNGGVMKANVIAAIKENDEKLYDVEYLLSWGSLTYSDIAEPITKEFYRIGWNATDISWDIDYNDISKSDFEILYDKYSSKEGDY